MRLAKETPNGCEAVQEVQVDSRRNRIHRVDDQADGVRSEDEKDIKVYIGESAQHAAVFLVFGKRYTLCSECGVNLSDADIR